MHGVVSNSIFVFALPALLVVIGAPLHTVAQPPRDPNDPAVLWQQATVYRDEWGVPHVYADNARAMAFAFGYAQAEDHIEPMLFAYRVANGRAAEIYGEAWAESDAFSLRMAHAVLARVALENADPLTIDLCEGFALGVNAWLLEHAARAPAWADGVRPEDVLALWHAFLMSMAPFDLPDMFHRPRAMETGNAWALNPARTDDGAALLVINAHGYYDGPFRWYEAHLAVADMDVAGATLYGLPVIVQGHNPFLGWALTPNNADFADMFAERIGSPPRHPADPRMPMFEEEQALALRYMSNAQPYYVRTETGLEERLAPSFIGSRGPVFDRGANDFYSWRIGGYRAFGGLHQLVQMARAQTLDAFQAAFALREIPCFHVVYADQAGNVFYLYNALTGSRDVPESEVRKLQEHGLDLSWSAPVPASLEPMAWMEPVPLEALPLLINPGAGYVQACGNPPWLAEDAGEIAQQDYPAWFAMDPDSFRGQRVRQLLRQGKRSFRDMQTMLYDMVAPAAVELVPRLLAAADARPDFVKSAHPDLVTGLDILRGWNFTADTKSPGMTFYHLWWAALGPLRPAELANTYDLYAALLENSDAAQELALNAAADAARMLRNEFEVVQVPWGDVHQIHRGKRREPIGGADSGEPIFVASAHAYNRDHWQANYGYAFAMIVRFADVPEAVSVVPFGASDNPDSPHFDDQLDLLLERRFKHTLYTREDVLRYAETAHGRRLELRPEGVQGVFRFDAQEPVRMRLETALVPPAPLPQGIVPFTLFVRPVGEPAATPVKTQVTLQVPAAVCTEECLEDLYLYVYEPGLDWTAVNGQELDAARRAFQASYGGAAVYVVAGPAACRIEPAALPPAGPPPLPAPSATIPVEPTDETGALSPPATPEAESAPEADAPVLPVLEPAAPQADAPVEEAAPNETDTQPKRTFKIERLEQGGRREQKNRRK